MREGADSMEKDYSVAGDGEAKARRVEGDWNMADGGARSVEAS